MDERYSLVAIALLLPLTAGLSVLQTNPYHALVIRGILGAVAALVYALFGAADVALTEALVGTMLSITLYAVAVRSSLSLRLGVPADADRSPESSLALLLTALRRSLERHHLRLEVIPHASADELRAALVAKEVHGICLVPDTEVPEGIAAEGMLPEVAVEQSLRPHLQLRVRRPYTLIEADLDPALARLSYVEAADLASRMLPNSGSDDSPTSPLPQVRS